MTKFFEITKKDRENVDSFFAEELCTEVGFEVFTKNFASVFDEIFHGTLQKGNNELNEYLYSPIAKTLTASGKRLRPLLTLLSCSLFCDTPSLALSPACAIEIFHTSALVHDDIADRSTYRRGELCLHKTVGEGLAINCGDWGLNFMTKVVCSDSELSDTLKLKLIGELNDMAELTIQGQALDIGWAKAKRYDIAEENYAMMATYKTAHYSVATPLVTGALCAGTEDPEALSTLRKFGLAAGLAFQIQDDIINLTSKSSESGKGELDDIREGKRTLIAIHALENTDNKCELEKILSSSENSQEDTERALEIIKDTKSVEYATNYAEKLIEDAIIEIEKLNISVHSLELLKSMAAWAGQRNR